MIVYLIKSSVCLLLFLLFYQIVLEKERMHQFNRFYLLGSIIFSFLAPLYSIQIEIPFKAIDLPLKADENLISNEEITQAVTTDNATILIGISIIISILLFIRFCINLYYISKKIRNNTKVNHASAILVLVEDKISPHSFWNYIFINKKEYNLHNIEDELLTHELTHVTQKHTIDVLFIEILKIIFWFNPLFYFLKKTIQLNHEFIADSKVINLHKNISEYQYLLLNKTAWNNEYYLASNLNYLLTKKRLVMMGTKTSKVNNWLKKLAVIPLLTGSIYVFAERVEISESKTTFPSTSEKRKNVLLETSKQENKISELPVRKKVMIKELKDSVPSENKYPVVNGKQKTFTYKNKEGKIITKRFSELTEEEKKMVPPPPPPKVAPVKIKVKKQPKELKTIKEVKVVRGEKNKPTLVLTDEKGNKVVKRYADLTPEEKKLLPPPPPPMKPKKISQALFSEIKSKDLYAVWIDGKSIDNSKLNNYTNTDFHHHTKSFVYENARSKRFPQKYQVHLYTKKYFDRKLTKKKS